MMRMTRLWTWGLAWAMALLVAGCGGGSAGASADEGTGGVAARDRIYLIAAKSGRLIPDAPAADGSARWTLELRQLHSEALWYTDRPSRRSGASSVGDYVRHQWPHAYGSVNPNATVHFQLAGQRGVEGVYASLSDPVLDEGTGTLRFGAVVLANSAAPASGTTLAITDVTVNILNNVDDAREVASYVQYAGRGALQPAAAGEQRLVLSQVDAQMLWVDNAPGVYHDVRPTSDFFLQWQAQFAQNPPNATLIGTTASGGLRAYFVTLREPSYDRASGTVSYAVTRVGSPESPIEEALTQVVLNIDSQDLSRFPAQGKGTAYIAFGKGYDPSAANSSYLYFGSDAARKQMGSLWGTKSYLTQSCEPDCRNDLKLARDMGVNLVRLYDWDSRNDHSQFLDHAHSLGIKVVVSISNWLPTNPSAWDTGLPDYFNTRNFAKANAAGRLDWHPAIAGVVITNELAISQGVAGYQNAIPFVARFLQMASDKGFSRSVRVGMPVEFAVREGQPPAWHLLQLFAEHPLLQPYRNQLMLTPQTYNGREFLFGDGAGTQGWVQKTYARFQLPILFTEIGADRVTSPNQQFVSDQLEAALDYQRDHPEQLLGAIHFQFANKAWLQTDSPERDTEGAFGTFRHGITLRTIDTVQQDYDYWAGDFPYGRLSIDALEPTSTYEAVRSVYLTR